MIRVLVVDDSPTARALLVRILSGDREIQVVGEAVDGVEAVELTRRLRPDLVTMDIRMPRMDGFEATKEIMIETPTPIVVVTSGLDTTEVSVSMLALRAGAAGVLQKPPGPGDPRHAREAHQLLETVKAISEVKVVRHRRPGSLGSAASPARAVGLNGSARVVAIAASTGGPAVLHYLLSALPGDFPAPILVVQHMTAGFTPGLATHLNGSSALRVKVAEGGDLLAPKTVYLAPDDRHLGVSGCATIALSSAPPVGGFRPSATFLFESVARAFGAGTVAVVLSGMGEDGVAGLRAVKKAGGRAVAQDEESSVVFGMPGATVAAGLADRVLPPDALVSELVKLTSGGDPMTRILVVEDSATQAAQLEQILLANGFTVEIAGDGQEGLARCAGAPFDLVMSDVLMPGLTGFELCRRLKADPALRDLPVILLTTLNDPMNIIEALECGAENFINKPYDAAYLISRVRTVLANKEMRAGRRVTTEVEICFMGKRLVISSDKEQILDLLISSLEDAIHTNRKLQASQAALEQADRDVRAQSEQLARVNQQLEVFAYTVSHDLKEPLRGIEALSGLLLEDCAAALDEQGKRYLDLVHGSALRMRQLIDDLLTFSRVGRQRSPAVALDLVTIASEVLAGLRFSLDEAGAQVALPPPGAMMVGYEVLLQQLFANLIGNALKYRRPDVAPRIDIAWRPVGAAGVEVCIADNGIGVPAEHRERVFGLFQRLHGRDEFPGTGVGLAICKRIVEEHEGTIALEETPGGGCTVRFTLGGSAAPAVHEAAQA